MTSSMSTPSVDVIIPVHTSTRPIRRAVSNVVASEHVRTRAIVVCHNIGSEAIAAQLSGIDRSRFLLLEHHDGIHSPAGPMNAGVRASSADYIAFLGSDDEYEAGAIDAWVSELSSQTDLLIGQFKTETGGRILAPAPRVARFSQLDSVKDLLYYRTPPLAMLIKRDLFSHHLCPWFLEGMPNGEDLALTVFLYSHARHITYSRCEAGFFGWESGADRVTSVPRPMAELIRPVEDLLGRTWVHELDERNRTTLAVKVLRLNVLEPCRSRALSNQLTETDLETMRGVIAELDSYASECLGRLTVRDARVAEAIKAGDTHAARDLLNLSSRASLWTRILPRRVRYLTASDGMLRRIVRMVLVPRTLRSPDRFRRA